jgi:hypothetical protein
MIPLLLALLLGLSGCYDHGYRHSHHKHHDHDHQGRYEYVERHEHRRNTESRNNVTSFERSSSPRCPLRSLPCSRR